MEVTAQHPFDLAVSGDDLSEPGDRRRREPHRIHVLDAGCERRMVERDDGGRRGRPAEDVVEPGQLLRVEGAAGLREAAAVEGDDAERSLDHAVGATVAIVDQPRERVAAGGPCGRGCPA